MENDHYDRRKFLQHSAVGMVAGVATLNLLSGCKKEVEDDVSPAEDLMREHGVLNRILLVYDTCKTRLENKNEFSFSALIDSAAIIRHFIEDYHEKLEEDFLFPRFEKANQLTDLVKVLRTQHQAGRRVTDITLRFANLQSLKNDSERGHLI